MFLFRWSLVGVGLAFRAFGCGTAAPCRCAIRVQTCDSARAASCWHSCALIQYNAGSDSARGCLRFVLHFMCRQALQTMIQIHTTTMVGITQVCHGSRSLVRHNNNGDNVWIK